MAEEDRRRGFDWNDPAINALSWLAVALVTVAALTFDHWMPLLGPRNAPEARSEFKYEPSYYRTPEAKGQE